MPTPSVRRSKSSGHEPGVVTGKPVQLGGSPGRTEATGRGVGMVTGWAAEEHGLELDSATVAIQGFGNVGPHGARYREDQGARVVAVSDARGGIHRGRGLDGGSAGDVSASMVAAAANLPTTCEATRVLSDRGIPVIPDILANAGGVTVSYLEWVQNRERYRWKLERVNRELEDFLNRAWRSVLGTARTHDIRYRLAAYRLAAERVMAASRRRGF